MTARRPEPVEIVDYDPRWPGEFERLAARARAALGPLVLRVEHVGSTAVPGLAAKPVIDLICVIPSETGVPAAIEALAATYVHEPDRGVEGLVGFRWPEGERRHHLYVAWADSPELWRMLAFRDRLREAPGEARAYADLKRSLAERFRDDRRGYTYAKTEYVERVTDDGLASKP